MNPADRWEWDDRFVALELGWDLIGPRDEHEQRLDADDLLPRATGGRPEREVVGVEVARDERPCQPHRPPSSVERRPRYERRRDGIADSSGDPHPDAPNCDLEAVRKHSPDA